MERKKGVVSDYIIWIGIAVLILVVGLVFYMFSTGKGREALEFIKNLLRFGG